MCRYLAVLRRMHVSNGVKGITFMTNLNPHLPEGVPTRMPAFEKATISYKQLCSGTQRP
jgi:hypothetical protein